MGREMLLVSSGLPRFLNFNLAIFIKKGEGTIEWFITSKNGDRTEIRENEIREVKDKDKSQDSMLVDSFPLLEILTFLCIILKLSGRNEDS